MTKMTLDDYVNYMANADNMSDLEAQLPGDDFHSLKNVYALCEKFLDHMDRLDYAEKYAWDLDKDD
jgi:hypothetical protein